MVSGYVVAGDGTIIYIVSLSGRSLFSFSERDFRRFVNALSWLSLYVLFLRFEVELIITAGDDMPLVFTDSLRTGGVFHDFACVFAFGLSGQLKIYACCMVIDAY